MIKYELNFASFILRLFIKRFYFSIYLAFFALVYLVFYTFFYYLKHFFFQFLHIYFVIIKVYVMVKNLTEIPKNMICLLLYIVKAFFFPLSSII